MSKKSLSSEEAVQTFKREVGNCLALLGFVNSKDKENLWKFWKTVTSAVKIAVNGKGDFLCSPMSDCKANHERKECERNEEEISRLKNLSKQATTVYVPMTSTDGRRQYHVLKFINQEKIDDYFEIVEPCNGNKAVIVERGEFPNNVHQSEITVNHDNIIAQISQIGVNNSRSHNAIISEVCDQQVEIISNSIDQQVEIISNSIDKAPFTSSGSTSNDNNNVVLNQELDESSRSTSPCLKKQKIEAKTWPVRKPTTRLSSQAKERNSILNVIPVKMRAGKSGNKIEKNAEKSNDIATANTAVDIHNLKGYVPRSNDKVFGVSVDGGKSDKIKTVMNERVSLSLVSSEILCEKVSPSLVSSEVLCEKVSPSLVSSEVLCEKVSPSLVSSEVLCEKVSPSLVSSEVLCEKVVSESLVSSEVVCEKVSLSLVSSEVLCEKVSPSLVSSEVLCEKVSESIENLTMSHDGSILRKTLIKAECNSPQFEFPSLPERETSVVDSSMNQIVQPVNVKVDMSVEEDPKPLLYVEDKGHGHGLQQRVTPQKSSSSDIETIISALEEELKKTGSGVHSISITSTKDSPPTHDIESSKEEVVELLPGQEIVEVQNVEDVIWNPDGSVQVVGTHTLIDSTHTLMESCQTVTAVNEDGSTVLHPIDAQYDVVEYEVLAEKGKMTRKMGGGKRRKRDKEIEQAEDKDVLDRTCPMCHRVLTYPSSMAAHMRIHTGDRPYSCGQCDRKFTTKANRDRHEATHVGLKPFKCTECEKCFTEKRSLKIHMRSHTGERPFVCTVCGRGFAQKCTLMVHMDRHTNRKGHLCDLCGKAFRQKCQLDIHVKRHNRQANYPCPDCCIKCYTKGDLVRHMIKHTGERPFQCNLCPRTFTRKQYLMDHENTHYGRKPYKCSICSMAFHDMGSCHRHVRKHREEGEARDGEKARKAATILTADDYDTIVKDSQAGKILTLEDGTQALVTAVDTEADGSTVYHITCVNHQGEAKAEGTSVGVKMEDDAINAVSSS